MTMGNPQSIGYSGANVVFGAAGSLDFVGTADRRFLWVKNGSGASMNVTIHVPGQTFGQNHPSVVVAVPAGGERMIGPLTIPAGPGVFFEDFIDVTTSAQTSITIAAVDLPTPPPDLP